MEPTINIRKVKVGDAETLAHIQTESWKNAFTHILSKEDLDKYTNINKAIEMYEMLLNNNIANGYILSIDEKAHCIAYWDKYRDEDMNGYAELICIHSLPDNWRKGYGAKMMERVLTDMKEAGFKHVYLWTFEENHRAHKFYEKYGFKLSDKSQPFSDAIEVMYIKEI